MYQHIQLRRLSSPKAKGKEALKQKDPNNFFNDDGELALKELSNEIGELEEVILVEDEPALKLPQLSNECWSNFVEELAGRYERGNHTNAHKTSSGSELSNRFANTDNISKVAITDTDIVVRISSDEDERCSPGISTDSLVSNQIFDEQKNMDSGQLSGDCKTSAMEPLDSDKQQDLSGTNKRYQDIKRQAYKLTFHQILNLFDKERPVAVALPATALNAMSGYPYEQDFPDIDMKEFVKAVKHFQESESSEDVKHLWDVVKIWFSAMKPPYGTSNYTKYYKKLNWYLTELMTYYINYEIENIVQNENNYKMKVESLMNTVSSLLNDDVKLKILTLLRIDFLEKMGNLLDDMFRKFLTHPKVRLENSDYATYRLKTLAFQKWIHYSNRRKQDIVDLAIRDGSPYLPKLVPKNVDDPFYKVDYNVHIIDEFDKQGTRKLLEEDLSLDILKTTIDKYLQVYENQLNEDFGFGVFCRIDLEKSKSLRKPYITPREHPKTSRTPLSLFRNYTNKIFRAAEAKLFKFLQQ